MMPEKKEVGDIFGSFHHICKFEFCLLALAVLKGL